MLKVLQLSRDPVKSTNFHEKYILITKLQQFLLSIFGVVVFTLVVGTQLSLIWAFPKTETACINCLGRQLHRGQIDPHVLNPRVCSMHGSVQLDGHNTTALSTTTHSIICNIFAHGTSTRNPPCSRIEIGLGGSGGAIYIPHLVLHHTFWSTQKGMSLSTFPGIRSIV